MPPLLLDTCAAIWLMQDDLIPSALDALDAAAQAGVATYISPITAWEVGQLVARGRLEILMTPHRWFARLCEAPGVSLAPLSPELLIAASFLPGKLSRDPADRILAATARDL